MSITYKTVLAEAVRGYNNIQTALAVNKDTTGVNIKTLTTAGSNISNLNTADQMVTAINKLTIISAGSLSGGGLSIGSQSVTLEKGETTGTGNITTSLTDNGTTEPTSGYYIAIKANTSSITASRAAVSASISTAGYISSGNQITGLSSTSTTSSGVSSTEYFKIPTSTCTKTGLGTGSSDTSGILIVHNAGYTAASTTYINSATVSAGKSFTVNNNSGNLFVNNNDTMESLVTVSTQDCSINVQNNLFDIKDNSGSSRLVPLLSLISNRLF